MPVTIVNNYTFPKKKKEQVEQKEEFIMVDDATTEVLTPAPVIDNPGQFPSLSNNLHEELNSYLGRSKEAVTQILIATREKAEFLEALAEKAKQDLEKEKHNISRLMGG